MSRKILVSCVCQSGPIASALQGIFPNDEIDAIMQPSHADEAGVQDLLSRLRGTDIWVRYMDYAGLANRDDVRTIAADMPTINIPIINFRAFHPDLFHTMSASTSRPVHPTYHSGIVVWAFRNGIPRGNVKKTI